LGLDGSAFGPPAPELAQRQRVKGARSHAVAQTQHPQAMPQLTGGLAGEGNRSDVLGFGRS